MKDQNSKFKPLGISIIGWFILLILFIGIGNVNRFVGYVRETYASASLETKIVNDTVNYMNEIKGYQTVLESSAQGNYSEYQAELQQIMVFFENAYKDFRYDGKKVVIAPGKRIKPLFITMSYCLDRYMFSIYTEKNQEGKTIYKINGSFYNVAKEIDNDLNDLLNKYKKNEIKLPVPEYDYMKKYDIPDWYRQSY